MKRTAAVLAGLLLFTPRVAAQSQLDRYVGYYELAPRLVATVMREGDHLVIRLTHQPKIELVAEADGSFSLKGIAARLQFTTDPDNLINGLVIDQNGREAPAPRIDAATAEKLEAPPAEHNWPMLNGTAVQVLTNTGTDYWPTVSPDGKTIVFARTTDQKHWELYRVGIEGGTAVPLARSPLPVSATRPRWSAAADLIAFTATTAEGLDQVWTIKPNGTAAHIIYGDGVALHLFFPDWSPDGQSLIMLDSQQQAIERANLASGQIEQLTNPAVILPGMASQSPDGRQIVLAAQKAGGAYNQTNTLWLIAGGTLRQIERQPLSAGAPTWSPDGRWIAFESDRGSADGRFALFLIHPDGSGLVQVTDYLFNANHPVFTRTMRHLVATVGTGDNTRIAIIELPELPK